MLKKVRSKVPAWLMCVALVQLALTGWFIKSLGTVDKDSIEDLSQPEVKIIVHGIETPQSYGKDDSPTFVTTLEEYIKFPLERGILENKESLEWLKPYPENAKVVFSIVIAAYNQADFLQETLNSIVAQSYAQWEVIIVDDGSTDTTWEVAQRFLMEHSDKRVRIMRKENGGLSDSRNFGMRYARGNWLCMLDSDDLLGKDYLLKTSELAALGADIVVGCMENFDAVSSTWCFPEGWSVVGVSHWNKFHASVLMSSHLVKSIGGYDQSLLWGLEDWNFWLSVSRHRPRVMHIPEITFYYRHHKGTSMRKEMFRVALEESKAMVRTNHPDLYEPHQLALDHHTIGHMTAQSLERLDKKLAAFPSLVRPHFWKGLYLKAQQKYKEALEEFLKAVQLLDKSELPEEVIDWQPHYQLALTHELLGEYVEALKAIDTAFLRGYSDEILACKYRLQKHLEAEGFQSQMLQVTSLPSYWDSLHINRNAEVDKIKKGTLAGKLNDYAEMQSSQKAIHETYLAAKTMLKLAPKTKCAERVRMRSANAVKNGHFEEDAASTWFSFESGYTIKSIPPRTGTVSLSGKSLFLENADASKSSGAVQLVRLHQKEASPVLIMGWSKAINMSGSKDSGYSLYIDITFIDGTHEWSFALPFDPKRPDWQLQYAMLERPKPIHELQVYCMLRGHEGTAVFDDVVVAPMLDVACRCGDEEVYRPSKDGECEACPGGSMCVFGFPLHDSADNV